MKPGIISKIILFSVFSAATIALGASNDFHKGSFQIGHSAQVNGQELKAGTYTVKWNGSGPDVEISIVSDGKVLATATAALVENNAKSSDDAVETSTTSDGVRTLKVIRFAGKKYSLEISGESAKAGSNKSSSGAN
ncbi:MAG TPA: hypothetical protein VN176_14025 [Verrucomicrobiae bacterium]|jgi:hypothetical protein|nr:hypothetical protein [Verrucomicrobiae bacterium]